MDERLTRIDAIERMKAFYDSIPDGASSYHKMDMLLRFMEKKLKVLPPALYQTTDASYNCEWKEEPEDPEHL